jgi:hypothetical protein
MMYENTQCWVWWYGLHSFHTFLHQMPGPRRPHLLTPPPGVHITLQRPPDIPSSAATQLQSQPKPSLQKKRRLLVSLRSRPSPNPPDTSTQAKSSETVQELAGVPTNLGRDSSHNEVGVGEYGVDFASGGDEMESIDGIQPPADNTSSYDVFMEAVMTKAILFFRLAPELYAIMGWDLKWAKRMVHWRTCIPHGYNHQFEF